MDMSESSSPDGVMTGEAGPGSNLHEPISANSALGERVSVVTVGLENLTFDDDYNESLRKSDARADVAAVQPVRQQQDGTCVQEPLERVLQPLHPVMEGFQDWFYKWIPACLKDSKEILTIISSILEDKFANLDEDMMLTELVITPHETISTMMIKTFCQIAISEGNEVIDKGLEVIRELIHLATDTESISMDTTEGLIYLYSVVEAFYMSTKIGTIREHGGVYTEEGFAEYTECSPPYDTLPELAKNCIKAVKAMFWGTCRLYTEQLEILEQVVEKDPDTLEWKMYYYLVMRMCRKQIGHSQGRPVLNPSEEKLIVECRRMDREHKMVKLLGCLHLSDYMKLAWNDNNEAHFIFGEKFSSKAEVMEYIRAEAKDILNVMTHSVRANLHIVECLTSVYPPELRDYELAKTCLAAALERNPKSSKANHRMAVILIYEKNFSEATEYCKLALEADGRNFPGFLDYTSLLLRNPKVALEEIEKTFEKMKKNSWPHGQVATIYCLEGILKFIMKEYEEALESFLKSSRYDFQQLVSTLKGVDGISKRFNWAHEACSVRNLHDYLEERIKKGLGPDDLITIRNLIAILQSILNRRENVPNTLSRGWRGRGGRSTANGSRNARGNSGTVTRQASHESRPQQDMEGATSGSYKRGPSRAPFHRGNGTGRQNLNNGRERDPINPTPQSGRGFQLGFRRGGSRRGSECS